MPIGPKTSSRFGELSQCSTSSTSWVITYAAIQPVLSSPPGARTGARARIGRPYSATTRSSIATSGESERCCFPWKGEVSASLRVSAKAGATSRLRSLALRTTSKGLAWPVRRFRKSRNAGVCSRASRVMVGVAEGLKALTLLRATRARRRSRRRGATAGYSCRSSPPAPRSHRMTLAPVASGRQCRPATRKSR